MYSLLFIGTSTSSPFTVALPAVNVTSLDCSAPWISTVSDGVAVGATGIIVGV